MDLHIGVKASMSVLALPWMPKIKQQTTKDTIPYLPDLVSFYKHVKARSPLHKDFDIREIDPEVLKSYDYVAKPFRHSFYCIKLLFSLHRWEDWRHL